jgi:tetratricopeptide (TPR) repeat protein
MMSALVRSAAVGVYAAAAAWVSHAAEPAAQAPYTYVHHVVSTAIPAAQFAFDRGLTLVFAYDGEEAERAFREAARLDPALAMAWWGIALAVGPDINSAPEPKSTHIAAESIARAKSLAETRATPEEREYIAALSARCSSEPKPDFDHLAIGYREAMRALVHAHPDDADAAALYAESIMDLRPWRLWTSDGKPAPDTTELVALLESGLSRHPNHVGLLHYYIHAVEASSDPGRALDVARRLAAQPMEPAAAHLVHMPAHIYLRTGDWQAAIEANEHSIRHALDYKLSNDPKQQRACGHCVDFLSYAYMMQGDEASARRAAHDFQELSHDPSNAIAVLLRFHEWGEMLAFPEPVEQKAAYRNWHTVRGWWHFGRGLAFTAKSRLDRAEGELQQLESETRLAPSPVSFGDALDVEHSVDKLDRAYDADSLKICAAILKARLAEARGELAQASELLREAVHIQDTTPYGEPPSWYYPVRESLGGLLLKRREYAEAEAVFRDGLRRSPRNPRLLLGLAESVRAQDRTAEAAQVQGQFAAAWRGGEPQPHPTEM